jgi:hypothetical protein
MIVCRECGHRNPPGTAFCENRDCGAFLEWAGEVFPTEAVPQVMAGQGPGWGASGPRRAGSRETGLRVGLVAERELQVEPDETVECEVTVNNTGSIVDQYTVQVFGEANAWTTVEPPSINLVPDAEGTVTVRFHPPRRPDVTAGTKPFRIVATSRENLGASAFADGTVTVAAYHEVATWLRPQVAEGRNAVYDVGVDNLGNSPIVARIVAVDDRQALDMRVSHPAVDVPPGGRGMARVQVQPRQLPAYGPAVTYSFRITVQAGWDTPRSMDAQLVHRPPPPPVPKPPKKPYNWLPVLRIVLTLLGGLLMILGSFSDWVPDVAGVEFTYEAYTDTVFGSDLPPPPEDVSTTFVSLGLIPIALGVIAMLGLLSETGKATRIAGGLALVLMLIFAFSVADADLSLASGTFLVLFGAFVALLGGIAARLDQKKG